jgi:predicted O-methyltransferase YrrM
MGQVLPDAISAYLSSLSPPADPLLHEIARSGRTAGIPALASESGVLLTIVARAMEAKRALEIGTGSGYSGICIVRGMMADGILITMESDRERAATARANFLRAGTAERTSVMVGNAARLVSKVAGPFDLILQDGDKLLYDKLHLRLVNLLRLGGMLVTDNVLWGGEVVPGHVAEPTRPLEETRAIAEYNRRLASDDRLLTTFVPVGDGLALSVRVK